MATNSIRQQFADTVLDIGVKDTSLAVIVGDISHFVLQPFAKSCPKRYYNIGICEPATMSVAAGFAKMGMNVVVHTIAPFLIERSFEQIKLDFCYNGLPGNIVTVGSAFDYSNLGCTHHCYDDFALISCLPNTQMLYPASPIEFDTLFRQAYNSTYLTVYRIPSYSHNIEFTQADILLGKSICVREGSDITLLCTGPHLKTALEAADMLLAKNYQAEVMYVHSIHPLDKERIGTSLQKTQKIIVIEEHLQNGGLGVDILREFHNSIDFKYASVSIPNIFVRKYGTYEELCAYVGLTSDNVYRQSLNMLS